MIRFRIFLPLIALVLMACAAMTPHVLSENVDFGPLAETHDEFVEADASLAPLARELALAESESLLALLAGAEVVTREALAARLEPVVDRYDAYLLAGWLALSPFEQRYLTRTSDIARDLAGLPLTEWPTPLLSPPVQ